MFRTIRIPNCLLSVWKWAGGAFHEESWIFWYPKRFIAGRIRIEMNMKMVQLPQVCTFELISENWSTLSTVRMIANPKSDGDSPAVRYHAL